MNTSNTNTNRDIFDAATELQLSYIFDLASSSSPQQQERQQQHHEQQEGGKSLANNHDSIDGVDLFQDQGTNKRIKISKTKEETPPSFFADLHDINEPSPQDMARRNKFVEKRRQRTEKHVINHAESILSRVLQIEAEDEREAPQDQPEEQVEAINENSGGSSRAHSLSARRSERHHFAVALDIFSELDDDEEEEF